MLSKIIDTMAVLGGLIIVLILIGILLTLIYVFLAAGKIMVHELLSNDEADREDEDE